MRITKDEQEYVDEIVKLREKMKKSKKEITSQVKRFNKMYRYDKEEAN